MSRQKHDENIPKTDIGIHRAILFLSFLVLLLFFSYLGFPFQSLLLFYLAHKVA